VKRQNGRAKEKQSSSGRYLDNYHHGSAVFHYKAGDAEEAGCSTAVCSWSRRTSDASGTRSTWNGQPGDSGSSSSTGKTGCRETDEADEEMMHLKSIRQQGFNEVKHCL
jgi:hypothetical protein